jgi:hypothetical protein
VAANIIKGKVHRCTGTGALYRPTAHRGIRGIDLPFLDHSTRRGWGVSVNSRSLFTPGKDSVLVYKKLGGTQGRSGQMRKISLSPGFDSRTVHPIARRYTGCATRFECGVGGVRHPQHTQTSSNSFTIAAGSSNGVTNTRCCRYSCMRFWWWD